MFTTRHVLNILRQQNRAFPGNEAQLQTTIESIDQTRLMEEARTRYRVKIWDRTKPLNGIAPELLLARDDVRAIGDGEVYLLYKDNMLVSFQPHDPAQAGFVRMTKEKAESCGLAQVDKLCEAEVMERILEMI